MSATNNIYLGIPAASERELLQTLFQGEDIRVERIVSFGQSSPETGWFDQDQDEWVLVLKGAAILAFEDGGRVKLEEGSYVHIPRHQKHRVSWTDPSQPTIWLTIFHGHRACAATTSK